jgi:DUF1707 SHOCT-like domain
MTVTDAERERVLRELRDRYAADALTHEEFDSRVSAALEAQSRADLMALVPEDEITASGVTAVSAAQRQILERQLQPDEWVAWTGRPDPAKHTNRADAFLIPFSIFWGGFAIVWEAIAIYSGQPFMIVWGLAFVVMGLYFMVGRFFYKANRRRRTVYAVTNRRVLSVVEKRDGVSVEARYLHSLVNVSTNTNASDYGTIEFDNTGPVPAWMGDTGMEFFGGGVSARVGLCFFDIEDVSEVAALAERLRAHERR